MGNQNGMLISSVYTDDGSNKAHHTKLCNEMLDLYMEAGTPDETITSMSYNADESEAIAEYKEVFGDYVKEARDLFITGALDVEDDTAWQNYLNELEQNGMTALIEANQTAYDRNNG